MASIPLTIDTVNALDEEAFVGRFGDVAEHSPWVAREASHARPFADRDAMSAAFEAALMAADADRQRAVLCAHPDLAGRAAITGELAPDSRSEQAGAGLDRMTADEYAQFTRLNALYRERHGIPFILAVKGATKGQILAAFEARTPNGTDEEFATALAQVVRIMRFRLEDRVTA